MLNYNTLNMANNCFQQNVFKACLKWALKIGVLMLLTILIKESLASEVRNSIRTKKAEVFENNKMYERTNGIFSSMTLL